MRSWLPALFVAAAAVGIAGQQQPDTIRFVFTSDAHYGLTRPAFRGRANVPAHDVNTALVSDINTLGPMDFIVEGGDVANREEAEEKIQSSAASWSQFKHDYLDTLKAPVYVVPGNHEASNAVGFYKIMKPYVDNTALVEIYNLMMAPQRRTRKTFVYATDRVLTSRDAGGVHFVFMHIWPDSTGRAWLTQNLQGVSASTPVVIFTHDQPEAESKHFRNPNGAHTINSLDRFENLLADTFADGKTVEDTDTIEQAAWEDFVRLHPNVVAYFHGNSNWNQFYDWEGPHHSIALHTFRVDSPMKGHDSATDETRLSYHVATIDTRTVTLTVRERLWNAGAWGESATVSLRPAVRLTHN